MNGKKIFPQMRDFITRMVEHQRPTMNNEEIPRLDPCRTKIGEFLSKFPSESVSSEMGEANIVCCLQARRYESRPEVGPEDFRPLIDHCAHRTAGLCDIDDIVQFLQPILSPYLPARAQVSWPRLSPAG